MKISKLKYEIDSLILKHEYEEKSLKMKHELELQQLKEICSHKYDDGSNAKYWEGIQRNGYEICKICGKSL